MKFYLQIQIRRRMRWLKELGVPSLIGVLLAVIAFVSLSELLFFKTEYAKWIYPGVLLSVVFKLCERKRNDILSMTFAPKDYMSLRVVENCILAAPFLIYLLLKQEYLIALSSLPFVIILAFYKVGHHWSRVVPTPFRKWPFEFVVGFRRSFLVIGLSYFLIVKAIQVGNYNLSLVAMGLLFLTGMSYYQKAEPEYFVWIYKQSASTFLIKKFGVALISISILTCIPLIVILYYFSELWLTTVAVYFGACVFLSSAIVAKYSAYPQEMNMPQAIFYALSLLFPPMLLIAIWMFYRQSKNNLRPLLEC